MSEKRFKRLIINAAWTVLLVIFTILDVLRLYYDPLTPIQVVQVWVSIGISSSIAILLWLTYFLLAALEKVVQEAA